jgi:hypothetical protein
MRGGCAARTIRCGSAALLSVAVAALGGCSGGTSNASNTDELLVSYREECAGVSECVSVAATDVQTLAGGGTHSFELFCPPQAPYFHNWDADQQSNVH